MNKALLIPGGIAVVAIGVIAYKALVPPSFSLDEKNKIVKFGGTTHRYGAGGGDALKPKFRVPFGKWEMQITTIQGQHHTFNLYKNGKFIKRLAHVPDVKM